MTATSYHTCEPAVDWSFVTQTPARRRTCRSFMNTSDNTIIYACPQRALLPEAWIRSSISPAPRCTRNSPCSGRLRCLIARGAVMSTAPNALRQALTSAFSCAADTWIMKNGNCADAAAAEPGGCVFGVGLSLYDLARYRWLRTVACGCLLRPLLGSLRAGLWVLLSLCFLVRVHHSRCVV